MINDNIILFWSKFDKDTDVSCEKWLAKEITISPFHLLSLYSHIKHKHNVYLFTYQKIKSKIPNGITIKDANDIYRSDYAFSALSKGHSIAHISDLVRLRVATAITGIVIDMDAVVINTLPDLDGFFSTMPAKATGGFAPHWGKSHPPFTIHDNSWDGKALSAFPLKVHKKMLPYITELYCKILGTLSKPPKKSTKAWNYVMWTLKEIARIEKDSKVFKPISCCPIPAWLSSGRCYSLESPSRLNGTTELFGYKLPSIDQILNESYIVQHFFESAFKQSKSVDKNFWLNVPNDCLVTKEAEKIFGNSNWREVLNKESNES